MTVEIYIDILLCINFTLDLLALLIAGRLCKIPFCLWRMLCGGVVGAAYSVAALYLEALPFYISLPVHLFAAVVICFVSFYKRRDFKHLFICTAVFAITGTLLGGIITAVYSLGGKFSMYNGAVYADINPIGLILLAVMCSALALLFSVFSAKQIKVSCVRAKITVLGKSYALLLMCDSGNLLTEPFSGLPVSIIDSQAFLFDITQTPPPLPVRAVPCITANGSSVLQAFLPDEFYISKNNKLKKINAYIALTNGVDYHLCDGIFPSCLY